MSNSLFLLSPSVFHRSFVCDTLLSSTLVDFNPFILQKSSGRGELLLSLCYQSTTNTLTVVVLKARNLPKIENNGPTGMHFLLGCALMLLLPL